MLQQGMHFPAMFIKRGSTPRSGSSMRQSDHDGAKETSETDNAPLAANHLDRSLVPMVVRGFQYNLVFFESFDQRVSVALNGTWSNPLGSVNDIEMNIAGNRVTRAVLQKNMPGCCHSFLPVVPPRT
jgi:hypothetical protein